MTPRSQLQLISNGIHDLLYHNQIQGNLPNRIIWMINALVENFPFPQFVCF